jgi:hypothetical protein
MISRRSAVMLLALLAACGGDEAAAPPPPAPVATVAITGLPDSANTGEVIALSAATRDAAGNALTGRTVTWTVSDTLAATVAATGALTIVGHGPFTVTATSEGKSGSASGRGILTRAANRFAYAQITQTATSATASASYNATGGSVRATTNGAGDAIVTLERLGRAESTWRETVMITRTGSLATTCHLNGWATAANRRDLEVSVACYATDRSRLPGTFAILVFGNGALEGRHSFVESTDAAATHAADPAKSFNSAGNAMTITRQSAGLYSVTVGNPRSAGKTENYFVTTVGPAAASCNLAGWNVGTSSSVECYAFGAARTDARFAMQLVEGGRAGRRWAYGWNDNVNGALGSEIAVSPSWAGSSNGQGPLVTRVQVNGVTQGVYDVRFPGLGALAAATHNIQVSPYSSGVVTCVPTTTGTATAGADLLVRVECFNRYSFAPTNAYFTILVIE